MFNNLTQDELWHLRAMIQKVGWHEFMSHIGSLLAEQADKVQKDTPQDKALFTAAVFMHNEMAIKLWKSCGFFDYRKYESILPDEYKELLNNNPPINAE